MIEKAPICTEKDLANVLFDKSKRPDEKLTAIIEKINDEYEYWDKVKYKNIPESCTSVQELWTRVKASRITTTVYTWETYNVTFGLTNRMQRMCHEFDMNFGGSWGNSAVLLHENREQYLISSLMEEAIFSSQMEGAATTRKVAKDMLRKKMAPKDKSQQMIANNYQTIRFIVENKEKPLTPELVFHIHRLMTEKTLENPEDAGRLRRNDDVVVEDGITHEVVHMPPSYEELPAFVEELCHYFNETDAKVFVHPIIRGIIIHFMVAYMHPFVDGNGRTARALFYWYMLKQGYWLMEYMSVSRVIASSKKSYEKAYQYVESDGMDVGYFIIYNLKVLEKAFKQLQAYLKKKQEEKTLANTFLQLGNINERQAQIIRMYIDNPNEVLTVKDVQTKFMVTATTAKSDITGLMQRGMLSEISFNKVKKGYIKGEDFDESIKQI
ncbi:MAG: Fic family protein [Bacteroidaceae bacterium]|nr:Fic family protein [Bacteroidaceae bacterium]